MNRFLVSILAVGLAGLTGCASNPLSPKGEAIYDALAADTRVRTWADACEPLSVRAEKAAASARNSWWRRNGELVESADYGLGWDLITVTDTRQHTGARVAMALTWDVAESAHREVSDALADNPDREVTCMETLSAVSRGEMDLSRNPETLQQLKALQQMRQRLGDALYLREAAVKKETSMEYGRSFYVVEKMTEQQVCPDARVSLLRNNWPDEVYLAVCEDTRSLLVRCEWGNCMVVD